MQILVDPVFSKVPIARPATVRIIDDAALFLASRVQEAKNSRARTARRAFFLHRTSAVFFHGTHSRFRRSNAQSPAALTPHHSLFNLILLRHLLLFFGKNSVMLGA
jgi:hypothetical protein